MAEGRFDVEKNNSMEGRQQIRVFPLNRVEGDLKVQIVIDGGYVSDAWISGTMYRGFENILVGRGLLDGLVITPRICGICSNSHLFAAAKALDMACGATVSDNAVRLRNIALMAEILQNDIRHSLMIFMSDFTNPIYKDHPMYPEAVRRYLPLKGYSSVQAIVESQKLLELIAIFGGQWPHSSFMVPGGVVSVPICNDIIQCRYLIKHYRKWYETRILGCTLDRWAAVRSKSELMEWLDESESHWNSDLGFFIRLAVELRLDRFGGGHENFISFGLLEMPAETSVEGRSGSPFLSPPGFYRKGSVLPFDPDKIIEDTSCAWFIGEPSGRHPFEGKTRPYASGNEGERYSWAKAPRYDGFPAETGPLAQMAVAGNPLFIDLIQKDGASVFVRQLARMVRTVYLLPAMDTWLSEITFEHSDFFTRYKDKKEGQGYGLVEAPRGGLGHWIKYKDDQITHYQVITPSTWNASPRDSNGMRGPWEEALAGAPIRDEGNPVEAGHVIRSFDPCLVCAVHVVDAR